MHRSSGLDHKRNDKRSARALGFAEKGSLMKRVYRHALEIASLAAIIFSLVSCGGRLAQQDSRPDVPDAEDNAGGAPPPVPPEDDAEEPLAPVPPEEGAGAPAAPDPQAAPVVGGSAGPVLAVDTVVALVNGEAITLDDLQRQSNPILSTSEKKYPPDKWPTIKELILKTQLENLIDRKLILMEVRDLGARIEESRVREFIMSLPDVKRSEERLAAYLVKTGMTYEQLRREVEELMLFRAILREKVMPNVRVAPGEIRQYYERHKDRFTEEASIHCFAISFLKRESPEEAAAVMSRAREALEKLKGGAYFPDVAKEYSDDPLHADKGGDWGWITPGRGPEKVASDAAFALKEGEYSGVVEGDAAYWILWVKEKREKTEIPFSAAWKEIELYLKTLKQDVEVRRWGQRLRLKAAITYPVPLSEVLRKQRPTL